MEQIKHWLAFTDQEIGSLQNFILEYIIQNNLSNVETYHLTALSANFQYLMRFVFEACYYNKKENKKIILNFLNELDKYPNICKFTADKMIETYLKLSIEKQYGYIIDNPFSFFSKISYENGTHIITLYDSLQKIIK